MVLIQEKVHRIFFSKEDKKLPPSQLCCVGRSFCFVKLQASLLNAAEQEA